MFYQCMGRFKRCCKLNKNRTSEIDIFPITAFILKRKDRFPFLLHLRSISVVPLFHQANFHFLLAPREILLCFKLSDSLSNFPSFLQLKRSLSFWHFMRFLPSSTDMASSTKDNSCPISLRAMKYATIPCLEYANINGEHNTLLFLSTRRYSCSIQVAQGLRCCQLKAFEKKKDLNC